ncbi:Histone deacetylase complex subunit SAP18 [Amphibalanus amphitrite]|uniref:Histone deacetylase complex subunit SAP18 n=1 Tax=Amphibalanus amphitrite TaxID=1232801 RepID=A0A6A4W999_AMPAM|nr:histone deacetylase complex subunit SAP18-like [Amphibalanus amphitrite]XP_043244878.1 histone deacetylase complex subunit SAP18-like [Amphibalanus amphitrite]XP_043244879.1 histone deacetylase complex subunit SAP18-like [Amphibalanus amphitrite]XP_043244880.1 histone deacetylase complex subunit SAP18-like [Amphibalanus amphitrite]XP_043244881.1 histone deacetylase complex subunit SAP18-like [Amphibalanus amphitrite]XP_043244882.1 histone deacetylase complex subunit SAP18-like [Amphibalanus
MMASLLGSKVEEKQHEPEKPIDREKTCPLLLRVFCNTGRHHSLAEYSRGQVPANELQIYTWMDATLKELTSLVKEVNPEARRKGTFFDFAQVYPEVGGRMGGVGFRMREIGSTCSGQKGADDAKTLASVRFTIGDYMDIAITPPNMRGGGPMMRRMRPF